jgi:hypothetical protein
LSIDFGRTAEDYARWRVGFPDAFFDRLPPLGRRVLDVPHEGLHRPEGEAAGRVQKAPDPGLIGRDLGGQVREDLAGLARRVRARPEERGELVLSRSARVHQLEGTDDHALLGESA